MSINGSHRFPETSRLLRTRMRSSVPHAGGLAAAKLDHLVEDRIRNLVLGQLWIFAATSICREHGDDIGVDTESGSGLRHIVCHDQVESLAAKLVDRILVKVAG